MEGCVTHVYCIVRAICVGKDHILIKLIKYNVLGTYMCLRCNIPCRAVTNFLKKSKGRISTSVLGKQYFTREKNSAGVRELDSITKYGFIREG